MPILKVFLSIFSLHDVMTPARVCEGCEGVIIELSRHYNSIYPTNISPAKTIQTQAFLLHFSNKLYMYK